jgi:hypothetical protein
MKQLRRLLRRTNNKHTCSNELGNSLSVSEENLFVCKPGEYSGLGEHVHLIMKAKIALSFFFFFV